MLYREEIGLDKILDDIKNKLTCVDTAHCTKDVKTMLKTNNIVIIIMSVEVKQISRWIEDYLRSIYNTGNILNYINQYYIYTTSTICKVLLNMHA